MLRDMVTEALRRYFAAAHTGIVAVYLFGSVARGQERADSDVDVGVLFTSGRPRSVADFDRLARLHGDLSKLLHREVDLVPLNGAPPDLLHRMLVDHVLVFEALPEQRIEFEVQARHAYFDLAPYLERYRRDVLRRA